MNKQRPSQRITLRQSKLLIRYQHLLHAVIVLFCIAGTASNPITWIAVTITFISWTCFSFLSKQQALMEQEIIWDTTGEWQVREGKGDYQHYPAPSSCFNSHWLTILGFQQSILKRHYLLLLPDNCDADAWRRLRIRLKQDLSRLDSRMPDSYPGSR
ncbi:protein YgfX [Sedimenticola selenatireducens]|uniref:Toxin CptA n=1 Tax=Sedimenticola selenatireducens TaxID=191960 RepID=A0A558DQ35_9GAMM|nr:protein YgfX [Sedimenticola selenatireducens]TVO70539.1 hypothetical protein FHP88_16770 [Sedimenticola selenatireducens]TVT63116.1 MAG: hypothetical protein FHK78_13145 [Sedimenticola selenatireducens]